VIRLQNTGSIRVTGSTRVTGHWRPGRVGSRVNVTDPVPSLVSAYHAPELTSPRVVFNIRHLEQFLEVLYWHHLNLCSRVACLANSDRHWLMPCCRHRVPTQMTESKFRTFSGLLQHHKNKKKSIRRT